MFSTYGIFKFVGKLFQFCKYLGTLGKRGIQTTASVVHQVNAMSFLFFIKRIIISSIYLLANYFPAWSFLLNHLFNLPAVKVVTFIFLVIFVCNNLFQIIKLLISLVAQITLVTFVVFTVGSIFSVEITAYLPAYIRNWLPYICGQTCLQW